MFRPEYWSSIGEYFYNKIKITVAIILYGGTDILLGRLNNV